MDGINAFGDFIGKIGFLQTVILILVLHMVGAFKFVAKYFKKKGTDSPHLHRRAEDNSDIIYFHRRDKDDLAEMKKKLEDHLVKEHLEDVKIGVMDTKLEVIDEKLTDYKNDISNIYRLLSDLKNLMIEGKN